LKKQKFLLVLLVIIAVIASGCTNNSAKPDVVEKPKETTVVKETPVANTEEASKESPILAALVSAGTLPALADRMPVQTDIMVEPVIEGIGQYGGDLKMALVAGDKWGVGAPTEESLFRFTKDGSKVEPNVAKSFEVNANSTEFTIHLREGMKWSDGVPFTADDVLFYWEHMLTKETFGKKIYDAYYSVDAATGDKALAEVTKIDDYTFKVTHKYPSVQFLERVAIDNKWFYMPAHFQKTILPEFIGEEKALEIAKQWGFEDTIGFLKETGYYYWIYPQIPTLRPWVATNSFDSDQFVMERNPYYWKTDFEGNQLPYMDRLVATKIQDQSQKVLGTLAGDFNLSTFDSKDFTVLKENEKKGDFRVIPWISTQWSSSNIQLNQTVQDLKLRELFQDIRFREALSVGVDRVEIAEIVTNGLADPTQASVPKGLMGYEEGWAEQWAKYDPERANTLLDEIGLTKRDKNNYRIFSDGSDLAINIIENTEDTAKFLELIKKAYEDLGIKTNVKVVDKATFQELKYSNQVPATTESISAVNVAFRPDALVPLRVLTPWFGEYGLYTQSGGKEGVKPEGDVALILEYWDNVKASKTSDEINKWGNEIIKLHMKNQWIIGYASGTPSLVVASNNMRNIPQAVMADEFRSLGHGHPAQFYIQQ
jgi:peptide/nickel transport system substrate-binding protein